MFDLALIIVLLIATLFLVWNFVPSVRTYMHGKSTLVETIITGALYYTGLLGEAIKEGIGVAQDAGYPIPDNLAIYVPPLIILYIIAKRLQTKTPVSG